MMAGYIDGGSQSESQLIDQKTLESVTVRHGEVYYYIGCGGCEKSNPTRNSSKKGETAVYQCAKESCPYDGEPRTYMIIRNIELSEVIPEYDEKLFVCFNSQSQVLLERSASSMSQFQAQEIFDENILGSTISATVDIRSPSDPDYGITLSLKDIQIEQQPQ